MLDWQAVKTDRQLVASIDWEMTPKEAFESYQLRAKDNWRQRDLKPVVYFYLSTWQGRNRVLLVRRDYLHSEELAQAPAPPELVQACATAGEGQGYPRGQLPLDEPLRRWLQKELGA